MSVGESKIPFPVVYEESKECYFVNGMKITGVAWLIRNGKDKSGFCIENRVALTKEEQQKIGDKQPFMLPKIVFDSQGKIFDDNILLEAYKRKMEEKNIDIVITSDEAKRFSLLFENRHFPMAVLRESVEGNENPLSTLKRGIKEECKKKFKENVDVPLYKFIYKRRGETCLLVYFIDDNLLEPDLEAIKAAGACNYFCAKSLKDISFVDNKWLETRNHEILDNIEIEKRLLSFEEKFGKDGFGCDLKYWGALKMWRECQKYF